MSVRLEVFHHLFASAAEEMGAALMRSAFSPNIKERRDFSCAIFDPGGRMISQAAHIPIHLGSAPLCVKAVREALELGPGDAALLNDPFQGGTHLPDITLVSPVFLQGAKKPSFYVLNRAHHADVGGAHPGSMAPAADVHGEGLRIPPVRLVRAGELDQELLSLVLANLRVPKEREGDLLAQWSANRIGAARLAALAEEHGKQELARRSAELMDWTDRLTGKLLRELPAGVFSYEDALEPATEGGAEVAIRVTMEKRGRRLLVDFTRTDAQSAEAINAPRAVTLSAVFYCVRLLLPRGTPTNEGVLRRVRVLTRPGTVVDARYPAAVAAGNVETSQRIVDCLLGALGRMLPGRVPASSAGTMSNLTFGGIDGAGAPFTYYETLAGGAGASAEGPGAHAIQTHMTNTRNTPIEAFESQFPVRVTECTVRRGSGGSRGLSGHAGGDGIRKRLLFLVPARVAWIAERQRSGPPGVGGGGRGGAGGARLAGPDRLRPEVALPGKSAVDVEAASELSVTTPGGGGFGND